MSTGITHPSDSIIGTLGRMLERAAAEWRIPMKLATLIVGLPFVILSSAVASCLMGKEVYRWFTAEDGFAETTQVLCYSSALILAIVVTKYRWKTAPTMITTLYLALCLGLVFLIGEELSWGQRLLGWETPGKLAQINKQGETNLHNIHGVGTTFKWIQLAAGAFGTFLPLIVFYSDRLRAHRRTLSMVTPPLILTPYFALYFIWRLYRNLLEAPREYYFVVSEFNEVLELIFASALAWFMYIQLRRTASPLPAPPLPSSAKAHHESRAVKGARVMET